MRIERLGADFQPTAQKRKQIVPGMLTPKYLCTSEMSSELWKCVLLGHRVCARSDPCTDCFFRWKELWSRVRIGKKPLLAHSTTKEFLLSLQKSEKENKMLHWYMQFWSSAAPQGGQVDFCLGHRDSRVPPRKIHSFLHL